MIEIGAIPTAPFNQADTIRLISTAYIDGSAMSPLADDEDEFSFLEDLEGLTSARRGAGIILPPGIYPDKLLTERHGYEWTYVNAAFCPDPEHLDRYPPSFGSMWQTGRWSSFQPDLIDSNLEDRQYPQINQLADTLN